MGGGYVCAHEDDFGAWSILVHPSLTTACGTCSPARTLSATRGISWRSEDVAFPLWRYIARLPCAAMQGQCRGRPVPTYPTASRHPPPPPHWSRDADDQPIPNDDQRHAQCHQRIHVPVPRTIPRHSGAHDSGHIRHDVIEVILG
ncbi:hypothetical protein Vretifemale_10754 [Volvox reticuliferus]|uniref:Uncharacterized protein n=1 Tax=Volvox reticuliferus TaxID=1737510 RepID=A0A8J4CF70_9CHLO|nr:hypothetical protein Vretifemale_10754 [Volvox reticuliferus]